jgi:hypothetical protein
LADNRLIVTHYDDLVGHDVAEVVHEALLRAWQRLRGWIDTDRQFLLWRQRLADARAEWQRADQADGYLLREAPLAVAETWLASRERDLADDDIAFIRRSAALTRRQEQARRRRRRQVLVGLSALATVLFILLLAVAGLWQEAVTQQRSAQQIQSLY